MVKLHAARRQVARLSFEDGEVVVTPKDRSIFVLSAEKAIEACRDTVRREERFERFDSEVLVPLHEWCVAHADRVRACYIPVPAGNLQVFIVTGTTRFDFDLAAEVASLELTLSQRGWRVGVSQLPNTDDESLATFFSAEGALEVYAEQGSTPQEGGK